jgi:hypothetical protein
MAAMSTGSPPPPPAYGPPPGPPPGGPYGPGPYGGTYAREHPQGMTILVIGILSLIVCGLLGPVAWVMGNNAIAEIDRNPSAYVNRSTVQAGRICGIVASAILTVGAVVFVVAMIALAASSS